MARIGIEVDEEYHHKIKMLTMSRGENLHILVLRALSEVYGLTPPSRFLQKMEKGGKNTDESLA